MNSITPVTASSVPYSSTGRIDSLLKQNLKPENFTSLNLETFLMSLLTELKGAKITPLKVEIFGSGADFIDRNGPFHDIDIRIEVAENMGPLIHAFKEYVAHAFASSTQSEFMDVFNYGVQDRHLVDKKSYLVSLGGVDLLFFTEQGLPRKHFAISDAMSYDILPVLEKRGEAKFLTEGFAEHQPRLERQARILTIDHPETVYHNGFIRLMRLCTQGERLSNFEAVPILLHKHVTHCTALASAKKVDLPHASFSYFDYKIRPYFSKDSETKARIFFNAVIHDCPLPIAELPELSYPLFQVYKRLALTGIPQGDLNQALAVFLFLSGKTPEPFFHYKVPDFAVFQQLNSAPLAPLRDLFLTAEELDLRLMSHVTASEAWKIYSQQKGTQKKRWLIRLAENAVTHLDGDSFQRVCHEAKKHKVNLNVLLSVESLRTFLPQITAPAFRLELANVYLQSEQVTPERTALLLQEIKAQTTENGFLLFKRFGKLHLTPEDYKEVAASLFDKLKSSENTAPSSLAFLIETGVGDQALILKMACPEEAQVYLLLLLERCQSLPLPLFLKIAELWRHQKVEAVKPTLIEKIPSLLLASFPEITEEELLGLLNDFVSLPLRPVEGLERAFEAWAVAKERNLETIEKIDKWCPLSISALNLLLHRSTEPPPFWLAKRLVEGTSDPRVAVTLFKEGNWQLLIQQLVFAPDWDLVLQALGRISDIKGQDLKTLYQFIQPYLNQIPATLLIPVLQRLQGTSLNVSLLTHYAQITSILPPEQVAEFDRGFLSIAPSQLADGEKHKKELLLLLEIFSRHKKPVARLLKPFLEYTDSDLHEAVLDAFAQNSNDCNLDTLQGTPFRSLWAKKLDHILKDRSQPLAFTGWQARLSLFLQTVHLAQFSSENERLKIGEAYLSYLLDHSCIEFNATCLNSYMQKFFVLFSRSPLTITAAEMAFSYREDPTGPKCWVNAQLTNKTLLQGHVSLVKTMLLLMMARYPYISKNSEFLTFLAETVEKNLSALLEHHIYFRDLLMSILNDYILSIPPEAGVPFAKHRENAKRMLSKALEGTTHQPAVLTLGSPHHFCYHLYLTGSSLSTVVTALSKTSRIDCVNSALILIRRLIQKKTPESLILALICSRSILQELAQYPEPPESIPELFEDLFQNIVCFSSQELDALKKYMMQLNNLVQAVVGLLACGSSHNAKYYQPLIVVRYLKAMNAVAMKYPNLPKPFEPELMLNLLKQAAEEDAFRGDYSIFYEAIPLLFHDFVHKVGHPISDPPLFDEITKLICVYPYSRPLQDDKAKKSRANTLKEWLKLLKEHNPLWAEVLETKFVSVKVFASF